MSVIDEIKILYSILRKTQRLHDHLEERLCQTKSPELRQLIQDMLYGEITHHDIVGGTRQAILRMEEITELLTSIQSLEDTIKEVGGEPTT